MNCKFNTGNKWNARKQLHLFIWSFKKLFLYRQSFQVVGSRVQSQQSLWVSVFRRTGPSWHICGSYRQLVLIGGVYVSGERQIQLTSPKQKRTCSLPTQCTKHSKVLPREIPHSPTAHRTSRTQQARSNNLYLKAVARLWDQILNNLNLFEATTNMPVLFWF